MKMPSILKRRKLRAATARRSRALGMPDELDYEEMSEPNMKLSRALLIVLVLHIVAVAGIIAFNTIKTRQAAAPNVAETIATSSPAVSAPTPAPAASVSASPNDTVRTIAATEPKPANKTAADHARIPPKTSEVADSGKIYVVVKGDNPVTIARKLHVSYDALLALNGIEDPRKLQIGQKLLIPAKTTKTKKSED